MSDLIKHRGPDGKGKWTNEKQTVGFSHKRLSIIDLTKSAAQPMVSNNGTVITYNGEIYNYLDIRNELKDKWVFKSNSDTECILASYEKYSFQNLNKLNGMFSFSIWDEKKQILFCARDRFGIKPFYYCTVDNIFYFASEVKALLPFLDEISTDNQAFSEYLTFQYNIGEKTLFKNIYQLLPGHALSVKNGQIKSWRYWDVSYNVNFEKKSKYFYDRLYESLMHSVEIHGKSDVPVGSYLSGGVDSSLIFTIARQNDSSSPLCFHGRFNEYDGYDESEFAKIAAKNGNGSLKIVDITSNDFIKYIRDIIYYLDFPVAGPGAFPQFMVSKLASNYVKVVLGGQGGDEIFGGYARYLIAYFEQALKAAIDGNYKNGNYVVTLESIIPNLGLLREYKPLIKKFWSNGLFEPMNKRYFQLINRATDLKNEILWDEIDTEKVFERFDTIFENPTNVKKSAYFDKMTHFDLKCLLPALLHVEDRMSMANGIETRVPFLNHELIELVSKIPADLKFEGGKMKQLLKKVFSNHIPPAIRKRRDKMGFPLPLSEWVSNELKEFINDINQSIISKKRPYLNYKNILNNSNKEKNYSRKSWGLISMELWYQQFHDQSHYWKKKAEFN